MAKIVWDAVGEKKYESGIDHAVLYPVNQSGEYRPGVAWNGITSIAETPEGAEPEKQYADNIPYLTLMSAEELNGSIGAFMSPPEFDECDGNAQVMKGVVIGQQERKGFGLSYRTKIGNDVDGQDAGYKLHLLYGAKASPSERTYETVNDSPEAMELSWDFSTTPVPVTGYKSTSLVVIDSTQVDPDRLATLEEILYGSDTATVDESDETDASSGEPRLPLPDEVFAILGGNAAAASMARFNNMRSL